MSDSSGDLPESIDFFTFRKWASTLFSRYVLKNINGLTHVACAADLYGGGRGFDEPLPFERFGFETRQRQKKRVNLEA